jgi:hypothetical protein
MGDTNPPEEGMAPPTLVTTNYDLLIEFAVAKRPGIDLTYTFNEQTGLRNIFQRDAATQALHYLKLHGSINWWGAQPGFRVSREGGLGVILSESAMATIAARYTSAGDDIDMIPPAFLKDVIYRAVWSDVWDEAHAVFSLCRHLLVLGYSFSPTDALVQNMATLGLARSAYLQSITVIDPMRKGSSPASRHRSARSSSPGSDGSHTNGVSTKRHRSGRRAISFMASRSRRRRARPCPRPESIRLIGATSSAAEAPRSSLVPLFPRRHSCLC